MTWRWRPLNSSRQISQRLTCQGLRMRPWASWSLPRLPIIVPRSATAMISPKGVTRFCLGILRLQSNYLRTVPPLLLRADLSPPSQPLGRTTTALVLPKIVSVDVTPEVVQERLALESDLVRAVAVVAGRV